MNSFSTTKIELSQFYKPLERTSDLDALIDSIGDSKYVSQIIMKGKTQVNTNSKFLKNNPKL